MNYSGERRWYVDAWGYAVDRSLLFPLAMALLAVMLIVPPHGNFPLNDDWVYADTVRILLEQGRYEPHSYSAVTLVAQTFWGALWCLILGFSYDTLRLSSVALALITAWASARIAMECGLHRNRAVGCGLLVLANPIFLNLSYTFMTDVPFCAMLTLAGLFYLRSLRSASAWEILLGSLFAALGLLIRQQGVGIGLAFLAAAGMQCVARRQLPGIRQAISFSIPWLVAGAITAILFSHGPNAPQQEWVAILNRPLLGKALISLRYAFVALAYMGLFTLPFACGRIIQLFSGTEKWVRKRWKRLFVLIFWAMLLYSLVPPQMSKRMPLLPNILRDLGAGPLTFCDTYHKLSTVPPTLPASLWWGVTILSAVAGGFLLTDVTWRLMPSIRTLLRGTLVADAADRLTAVQDAFLVSWVTFFVLGNIPFLPSTYDRYLLPVLPACLVLAGARLRPFESSVLERFRNGVVHVLVAGMFLLSTACVQDYLAWNCARWRGIDLLRNSLHIAEDEIDGGYEYYGAYVWARDQQGWEAQSCTYALSPLLRENYEEIAAMPYFSFLGMTTRHIKVLKGNEGAEGQTGAQDEPTLTAEPDG